MSSLYCVREKAYQEKSHMNMKRGEKSTRIQDFLQIYMYMYIFLPLGASNVFQASSDASSDAYSDTSSDALSDASSNASSNTSCDTFSYASLY